MISAKRITYELIMKKRIGEIFPIENEFDRTGLRWDVIRELRKAGSNKTPRASSITQYIRDARGKANLPQCVCVNNHKSFYRRIS